MEQSRIHPDERFEVFVVFDPVKGSRIARNRLLEPVQRRIDHIRLAGFIMRDLLFVVHRQHCTLQAFGQFGALYMHNLDDTHSTRPGWDTSTSEFRATTGPNISHRGRPILHCQQLASPKECVLLQKLIKVLLTVYRSTLIYWSFRFFCFFWYVFLCGSNRSCVWLSFLSHGIEHWICVH